jgi:hypothetical protein
MVPVLGVAPKVREAGPQLDAGLVAEINGTAFTVAFTVVREMLVQPD